jgi:hypothetical protein
MKLTLGEIFNSQPMFEKLIIEKLPFRTVINLSRLIERLSKELTLLETERVKLLEKYGTQVDNHFDIKDENKAEFATKINELFAVEIEVADVNYFDDTEFEQVTLTLNDYMLLKPFISQ